MSSEMQEVKKYLKIIAVNVGKTFLNSEQTLDMFRWCLHEHIQHKLEYASSLLVRNDIKNRKEQIKASLKNEFMRITQEESVKLSSFNTPAGDLGKILMSIDFDKFMGEIYVAFFNENADIRQKSLDMKSIMNSYVNNLNKHIQDEIKKNYI